MFGNFTQMIAGSLNLSEPWYIKGAEFDTGVNEFHIHVDVRDDAKFTCPQCGKPTIRYGYEPSERKWRHGDCLFYPTYVYCRRPRVLCPDCGVVQLNTPYDRKNSRFTLMFEGYAMLLLADVPVARAARILRCDEKSLTSILHYWVNQAVDKKRLDDVTNLAIDETSMRRGHDYVTLVIDSFRRSVIDVERGRDKETISMFADKLEKKGGSRKNIVSVTSDMSKAYLSAIREYFPYADNVIDKFHVKQAFLTCLDEVRKAEQRETESKVELFRGRRLFMIPRSRLTDSQAAKMAELCKMYPKTGRASRIVAALDEFYSCNTMEEADEAFEQLYSWMRRCRLPQMKNLAETLRRHKSMILAYFRQRQTNAICEGINSIIQAAKRRARGYPTFRGFKAIIYLIAGKLELGVKVPF